MGKKISIIIAVYNSAQYIERCLHTLFSQTYRNLEYIFVNDGSEDESVNIINKVSEQYTDRKEQVKIICHEHNMGVSQARATGILEASGDYMIHCDPDDYVELNWCELLINEAELRNADIVVCSYLIETGNESIIKRADVKEKGEECVLNIYNNVTWRSLCNKLIKSSLINDNNIMPFKDCNVGEDWSFVIRCLNFAGTVTGIDTALYHYCVRMNSLSNNPYNLGYLEPVDVFKNTYEFLDSCKNPSYTILSDYFKFIVKLRLRNQYRNKIKEWFEYNSECHKSILAFTDHSIFNRFYLRLLLYNMLFYKFFMKFSKIRKSIFSE